jgi:hypothetical protein
VSLHLPDTGFQGIRAASERGRVGLYLIVDEMWLVAAANRCSNSAAVTDAFSSIDTNLALRLSMTSCWWDNCCSGVA